MDSCLYYLPYFFTQSQYSTVSDSARAPKDPHKEVYSEISREAKLETTCKSQSGGELLVIL